MLSEGLKSHVMFWRLQVIGDAAVCGPGLSQGCNWGLLLATVAEGHSSSLNIHTPLLQLELSGKQ